MQPQEKLNLQLSCSSKLENVADAGVEEVEEDVVLVPGQPDRSQLVPESKALR